MTLFYEETLRQQKNNEAIALEQEERSRALQTLLNIPEGLAVLYWIINLTGVFTVSFTGNSETFFREGKRAIGIALYKELMRADAQSLQKIVDFMHHQQAQKEQAHAHSRSNDARS